ncbi:hypothetical protein NKR23_g4364 [Pleurostoma richardsiae]|uniref:Uncharacterized protein n=1 Tax=Pleurostoma richardsiae TaxID=41990 RepID=A0AA38VKL5_9PEZI|nr:hypothetical protein NKR23_g4364 [Pleurostoma richardsiae]
MFDKLFKDKKPPVDTTGNTDQATAPASEPKKSLYRRYQDAKTGRNNTMSDDDLKKYTGMDRAQLEDWAKDRPNVGGNQSAGSITAGGTSGLGGMAGVGEGLYGWGLGANAPLKYPPVKKEGKKLEEDDDDD